MRLNIGRLHTTTPTTRGSTLHDTIQIMPHSSGPLIISADGWYIYDTVVKGGLAMCRTHLQAFCLECLPISKLWHMNRITQTGGVGTPRELDRWYILRGDSWSVSYDLKIMFFLSRDAAYTRTGPHTNGSTHERAPHTN